MTGVAVAALEVEVAVVPPVLASAVGPGSSAEATIPGLMTEIESAERRMSNGTFLLRAVVQAMLRVFAGRGRVLSAFGTTLPRQAVQATKAFAVEYWL